MELSPQQIRTASFGTARKGYDPKEVESFLDRAADVLESAQNHSTAMEAKARAAVARLQETSVSQRSDPEAVPRDQADQISRTLLLAQRAADDAVAEARAEAQRILEAARAEAAETAATTRERADAMLDEARAEARAESADERRRVRGEVEALLARREFLSADVDQLETFLEGQRDRLRAVAVELTEVADRAPEGLGYLRPPLQSAVSEADLADAEDDEVVSVAEHAEGAVADAGVSEDSEIPESALDETEAIPFVVPLDVDDGTEPDPQDPTPASNPDQLRFRPDLNSRGEGRGR